MLAVIHSRPGFIGSAADPRQDGDDAWPAAVSAQCAKRCVGGSVMSSCDGKVGAL